MQGVWQPSHVVSVQEGLVADLEAVPVQDVHAAVGRQDVEDVAAVHVVGFAYGGGVALERRENGVGKLRGDGEELGLVC